MGLAGLAGVAATGVVVARAERRRRAYSPDEVRDRLHRRLAEAAPDGPDRDEPDPGRPDPGEAGRGTAAESDDIGVPE